jgi:PAS domain-containing protein
VLDNLQILENLTAKLVVRESELKTFFRLSIDLLCIANQTHFTRVNPAWERELGWPMERYTTVPWLDQVHPDDRAAALKSVSDSDGVINLTNRYLCKDGSYKTLVWRAILTDDGIFYCVVRVKPNV